MIKRLGKFVLALVSVLFVIACTQIVRNSGTQKLPDASPEDLRIGTYNVHYIIVGRDTGKWSLGDWERRKKPLDLAFKHINADIVAFQEMESFAGRSGNSNNLTLDWLLANNPDFGAAAVGDPAVFPSTQPILFRKDRLSVLDQGWFFFSDTPDVIYARTYNGSYPAFASWAAFQDQLTGQKFRVLNIHTDYGSRSNRLQSAALVAERIAPWIAAKEAFFVVGDLNARAGDEVLSIIETPGVTFRPIDGSTYHFNMGLNLFGAIDHIGYSGDISPVGAPVVTRQKFAGEWPTDHYPVTADFSLN